MTSSVSFADEITVDMLEDDPYPIYERLRREAPVCWIPALNVWLVTRFDLAEHIGSHPELFSSVVSPHPADETFGTPTILTAEGATHKELRRAVDPKFRPRVVDSYIEELVTPIVQDYISRIESAGSADLMSEYFEPISVLSLRDVLGLEMFDADTLRRWFFELAHGATNYEHDPEKQAIGDAAAREIDERVGPVLDQLEHKPNDSALSHMLHAGMPEGHVRDRALIMPTVKIILLGGMQEPGHAAGTSLWGLLTTSPQDEEVAANPELIMPAIEEGLRWMSPIGSQVRTVKEPLTLDGVALTAGEHVCIGVAAVNRDPDRFPNPDRFDIHRQKTQHGAFGFGQHFCSGHWFGRQQERIALEVLFERLPNVRLDPDHPPVVNGWDFRAPKRLPVVWDPA